MTMLLKPNNDIEPMECPIGFYEWLMLDVRCGDAIGFERCEDNPNQCYYYKDKNGHRPMMNDGYIVGKKSAENMAKIAIASITLPEFASRGKSLRRFAKFCIDSDGFEVW